MSNTVKKDDATTAMTKVGKSSNVVKSNTYNSPTNYVQIGCNYYFVGARPDALGHYFNELIPWNYSQIKRDFANNPADIDAIPRFLGLGNFPCNTPDYVVRNGEYYNTYSRIEWIPTEGKWDHIEELLRHIFGAQYVYGLDYLEILYLRPTQILPILILVSARRNTGKTTFLNFLKEMFGANMVFVTNETMRSNFNAERAGKLIIACDEAFLNKKEDSERLKALATAKKTHIEFKGKDRFEIDNFAKIILCSNNVVDPVYIDSLETRYWVREIPALAHDDPNFLSAMKKEIPAFLHFLRDRQMHVNDAVSRMWFDPTTLRTPALVNIMQSCRPSDELELAEFLIETMDDYGVDALFYTWQDLSHLLKSAHSDIRGAHRIICKVWAVPHASSKMAYDLYAPIFDAIPSRRYGRYYTFHRSFLAALIPATDPVSATPMDGA